MNDVIFPNDILYEISTYSIRIYRAIYLNTSFYNYIKPRMLKYQHIFTFIEDNKYYVCARLHRLDGPAIIDIKSDRCLKWRSCYSEQCDLKMHNYFPEELGTHRWYKNGKLHRDNDLPAIIRPDGTQYWFNNGKLHRDNDLPAVISPKYEPCQIWYKDGKIHRENGPACMSDKRGNSWYYKNERYNHDDYIPDESDSKIWIKYFIDNGPAYTHDKYCDFKNNLDFQKWIAQKPIV